MDTCPEEKTKMQYGQQSSKILASSEWTTHFRNSMKWHLEQHADIADFLYSRTSTVIVKIKDQLT